MTAHIQIAGHGITGFFNGVVYLGNKCPNCVAVYQSIQLLQKGQNFGAAFVAGIAYSFHQVGHGGHVGVFLLRHPRGELRLFVFPEFRQVGRNLPVKTCHVQMFHWKNGHAANGRIQPGVRYLVLRNLRAASGDVNIANLQIKGFGVSRAGGRLRGGGIGALHDNGVNFVYRKVQPQHKAVVPVQAAVSGRNIQHERSRIHINNTVDPCMTCTVGDCHIFVGGRRRQLIGINAVANKQRNRFVKFRRGIIPAVQEHAVFAALFHFLVHAMLSSKL